MTDSLLHSLVLAQIFGLYLMIKAIIMLSRTEYYRKVSQKVDPYSFSVVINASFGLLLGIFLVDVHNVWVMKPRLIVTLIAWIVLIRSVLWLSIPEQMCAWGKQIYKGSGYYVVVLIQVILGILLLTRGFYLYMTILPIPGIKF